MNFKKYTSEIFIYQDHCKELWIEKYQSWPAVISQPSIPNHQIVKRFIVQ
jgi:hypothetical protein